MFSYHLADKRILRRQLVHKFHSDRPHRYDMFLLLLIALFACAKSHDLHTVEVKFQVLTPNELMVEVPHLEDQRIVTFRIGVTRAGQKFDDLELGENDIKDNRVFIYDHRLNLRKDDVVNYLVALKDMSGYQAKSGKYHFDGVYYKKPFNGRHRFRRNAILRIKRDFTDQEFESSNEDNSDSGEFNPLQSRFGGPHHHGYGYWHPQKFNSFGPPTYPVYGTEGFNGCGHHPGRGHHRGHGHNPYQGNPFLNVEEHCKICNSQSTEKVQATTTPTIPTSTSTTTDANNPDIDIRFSN